MTVLDRAEMLLQARNYSGAGNWLDEANSHDAVLNGPPVFTDAGDDSFFTLDGAADYFQVADDPGLDFTNAEDFTIMVESRTAIPVPAGAEVLVAKASGFGSVGYFIYHAGSGVEVFDIRDGVDNANDALAAGPSVGVRHVVTAVRNTSDDDIEIFADGVGTGTPTNDDTNLTLATALNLRIGRFSGAGAGYLERDVFAVALWREALSDADVLTASGELRGISAAVTGSAATAPTLESEIVVGMGTIVITLTNDTWVATVGANNAITTALIAGIDSAGVEVGGWDAVVRANMVFTDVTRLNDTTVQIILGDEPTYAIDADETITVTIPATALTIGGVIVAAPTFDITAEDPADTRRVMPSPRYGITRMARR